MVYFKIFSLFLFLNTKNIFQKLLLFALEYSTFITIERKQGKLDFCLFSRRLWVLKP